jgi:cell division cycle 2-like
MFVLRSTCLKKRVFNSQSSADDQFSKVFMSTQGRLQDSEAYVAQQRKRRRRFAPKSDCAQYGSEKHETLATIAVTPGPEDSVPVSHSGTQNDDPREANSRPGRQDVTPSELPYESDAEDFDPVRKALGSLMGQSCRSVECYERLNFIDEGTYGRVFRARDIASGDVYALKQVKIAGEREGFPITALREVSLLLATRHPNIVHVREVVVGSTLDKIYMVMEYAEHDLRSILERMRHPYSQSEVKSIMHQVLDGISHLHASWIIHRDLKTSNLLLTNGGVVKVCDFGLARRYGDPSGPLTPHVTTLWYRAPEILLGDTKYTTAVDMWAVGCIFAELILRDALFAGRGELDQLSVICGVLGAPSEGVWPGYNALPNARRVALQGPPRSELSTRMRARAYENRTPVTSMALDLLARLLVLDPKRRISAAEALQHPYFDEAPPAREPHLIQTMPERHER